ncbi:MAG: transporter [Hyphomonas sp.]
MKRHIALAALAAAITGPAFAQLDGARVNVPLPKNTNLVGATYVGGTANASWSAFNRVQGDVDIDSSIYALSYTRSQPLFGRTIHWTAILPAGTLRTDSPLPIAATNSYTDGLGDVSLGATVNLYGAPALPVRETLRYELDWTASLGVLFTAPTGSYDADEILNLGSNQWSTRISAPIVKSFGDWVPGRRTILEVTPSVRVFGDNGDSFGETIEQDPVYAVETHLSRDMTDDAFISLDYTWISGGEQTRTNNATGAPAGTSDGLNAQIFGATIGYKISDNFSLFVGHQQTVGESGDPFELRGALTSVRLVWGWHDVIQRRNDFLK